MVLYQLRDRGTDTRDRENFFGLQRADGTGKPAYRAVASAIRPSPVPAPEMHGAIAEHYYSTPGLAALFGPTTTPERTTPDTIGRYNHFDGGDGGSIYWTPSTGAWSVHGAIRGHWASLGWEAGPTGYPTTDERTTPDGVGRYNHFTGGGRGVGLLDPGHRRPDGARRHPQPVGVHGLGAQLTGVPGQ